jgi:hypothetical protein
MQKPPPTARRPAKAVLFAPHSNECPAVAVPMQEVANRLRKEGVQVETCMRKGMMERTWEVRRFVSGYAKEVSNPVLLSSLLSVEDACIRLESISNAFLEGPKDTIVAEFHAMDEAVLGASTLFLDKQNFEHIANADALKCRSPLAGFTETLEFGGNAVEYAAEGILDKHKPRYLESIERFSELLSRHMGMDLYKLCSRAMELVNALRGKSLQMRIFEFPSISRTIPREHSMHSYYYTSRNNVRTTSRFEEVYASVIRYSMGRAFRDTDAVADEFRLD